MTFFDWLQIALYLLIILLLVKPLGAYMARVHQGEHVFMTRAIGPVERFILRIVRLRADEEMGWKAYAVVMLLFNFVGLLLVYALQRFQSALPLNPQDLSAVRPNLAYQLDRSGPL